MSKKLKNRLHEVVFEADTPTGKTFDLTILFLIILSVSAVILESVDWIAAAFFNELRIIEWICTGLFTLEYLLRLYCVRRPLHYVTSFFWCDRSSCCSPGLSVFFYSGKSWFYCHSAFKVT